MTRQRRPFPATPPSPGFPAYRQWADRLLAADWFYHESDDIRVFRKWSQLFREFSTICQDSPAHHEVFKVVQEWHLNGGHGPIPYSEDDLVEVSDGN